MSWTSSLIANPKTGKPSSHIANAGIAFRECPLWKHVLAYDEHANRMVLLARPRSPGKFTHRTYPAPVTDADVTRASEWLCKHGVNISETKVGRAMTAVAMERGYHPVRQYLHGLQWDGVPRIDRWLAEHLGAEDTALNRAFARKFLIAAVARVENPGCKVDTALVLEGPQGIRKSTTARILFGGWFTDHTARLDDKDTSQALQGVWCVEFAELSQIKQARVEEVKAFLTRQEDRFRVPYGHLVETYPRQCVFIMTLNPDGAGYLKDPTGARRFWVVKCGVEWKKGRKVDTEALAAVRDQIWSEALAAYRNGEIWWLDSMELETAQADAAEARREPDPWEDTVATEVAGKAKVTIATLLANLIGIELEKQTRAEQKRMASILTALGWEPPTNPEWFNGVKARYWTKTEAAQ